MGAWREAMDEQLDLIRFWKSQNGRQFAELVIDLLPDGTLGAKDPGPDDRFGKMMGDWTAEDLITEEAERLNRAETYFVHRDMGTLTLNSCKSRSLLPQPLQDYHLPTPTGFVYFENELHIPFGDDVIPIKAVMWRPRTITMGEWPSGDRVSGVSLSFYQSRNGTLAHPGPGRTNVAQLDPAKFPKLWLYNVQAWPYNMDWYGEDFTGTTFDAELARTAELRRFMAAFWAHIQTTVYVWHEPQPVERHTKKRALRAGFLADPDKIRVILLRKKYNTKPDGGGEGHKREYSHRFPRAGHWRNQFYPSQQQHHQIWIAETIVGDESLPLLIRDRIYNWKR